MIRYEMPLQVLKKSKISGICVFGGGSVSGFCLIDIDNYKGFPDFCEM